MRPNLPARFASLTVALFLLALIPFACLGALTWTPGAAFALVRFGVLLFAAVLLAWLAWVVALSLGEARRWRRKRR